ncbi:hypothetical protein NP493_2351g00002 [Ridgeia piscesae]|uniref:Uncharacterized protein n=1 Tax=Ridgeia piscesae TaxID=27915 RepID=A0AAD9N309_RIDPI|nr:hypothetical protein NP493_2351g00002 [Ridgeia piscesae]
MGGEGKLYTRRGMGGSVAGRIQHSQDIYWQARQKTPGLVRLQRSGATDSYDQKRLSSTECVGTRSTRSTIAAYKDAGRLIQKWESKAVELQRAADRNNMKGFYNGLNEVGDPRRRDLFT